MRSSRGREVSVMSVAFWFTKPRRFVCSVVKYFARHKDWILKPGPAFIIIFSTDTQTTLSSKHPKLTCGETAAPPQVRSQPMHSAQKCVLPTGQVRQAGENQPPQQGRARRVPERGPGHQEKNRETAHAIPSENTRRDRAKIATRKEKADEGATQEDVSRSKAASASDLRATTATRKSRWRLTADASVTHDIPPARPGVASRPGCHASKTAEDPAGREGSGQGP